MKKRNVRIFSAALMCIAILFSLAGCASGTPASNAPAGEASGEKELVAYRVGHSQLGPDWIMAEYSRLMEELMKVHHPNGVFDYSLADFQADNMQNAIQSYLGSGVDAINWYAIFAAVTPNIIKMCEDAGVPVGIGHIPPTPDQYEMLQASPVFTGYTGGNLYWAGYQLGEQAIKNGGTVAIIEIGVPGTYDMESKRTGFTDAFEAGGGKVVAYSSASTPAEALPKSLDMLNAHPDADVAYAGTGFHCVGLMQAVRNLNREDTVKIYSSDIDLDLTQPVRDGIVAAADGGSQVEMILSLALTLNWLDGHKILDENGKAPILDNMKNILVTIDNVEYYQRVFVDSNCFTTDMFKHFLYRYNPDVSYQTFKDFADNYNYEWFMEFRKSFGAD